MENIRMDKKPANNMGLTQEEMLKLECYKTLMPFSRDINGIRRQVEDLIKWLKESKD
jgi:hypothetical protein